MQIDHPRKQLGQWAEIGAAFIGAMSKDGGGSGGGGSIPGVQNTVSTNVTVSPQISPQFIQQQSPSNSPINAGVSGTVPATGMLPGFDWAGGTVPGTALPFVGELSKAAMNPLVLLLVAGGIAAMILKRHKAAGPRRGKRRHARRR